MLLNQEWKMAINSDGEPYLLFDVKNDPDEVNDLVVNKESQKIVSQLRLRILERLMSARTKK